MSKSRGGFWCRFPNHCNLSGDRKYLGQKEELFSHLYASISTRRDTIWDPAVSPHSHGGIFNLQYSNDGSILVAATENTNVLIFDANNHKLEHALMKAHNSSVNYIKFLDTRMFATCSDDCTLALWDLRMLNQKMRSLRGHTNWVKNIEYDHTKGLLVSSGYDGLVIVWDINKFLVKERPLQVTNLLRMRLSHDLSKMIISTNDGYMMVIHDLDLITLGDDLRGFSSDLYHLMQRNYSCGIDMGSWFNKLFTSKRNRVELISDFPEGNIYGHISSLEVHPNDWCIASRNTNKDQSSEWTCMHDIEDFTKPNEFIQVTPARRATWSPMRINPDDDPTSDHTDFHYGENNPVIVISRHVNTADPSVTYLEYSKDYHEIRDPNCKVYKNIPRLKYFLPEPNENEGFIKEISFSPDGRVLCSPYQFGYRILSYNAKCSEFQDSVTSEIQPLYVVKKNLPHPDHVVTTKFSPTHCQISSGCLGGRVIFSYPIL